MHLGIDFGTSTTVAVLTGPDGQVRPLLFDGSPLLRSAVYLDATGILVGRAAVERAGVDPARYEPNPKLCVDDGTVTLGPSAVPVSHLFAAVLQTVHAEALRVTGGVPPLEVALTHPASWDPLRRGVLLTAASLAGLPPARLVAAPVAAAYTILGRLRLPVPPGRCLVVYDLGAGAFEVTVVRRTATGLQVAATAELPDVGGLDVDAVLTDHLLAAAAAAAGADFRAAADAGAVGVEQRRQVSEHARFAKELLSHQASTIVPIPGAGAGAGIALTRADLERLAMPLLRGTADLTLRTMRTAGVDPASVAGVFLVGGASRMPLVATLLHRFVGVAPVAVEQPDLTVAEGSVALLPVPGPATEGLYVQAAPTMPSAAAPTMPSAAALPGAGTATARAGSAPQSGWVPLDAPPTGKPGAGGAHLWSWLPVLGGLMPGRPWRNAPFHPLQLGLPSGSGWTIRARFVEPDETLFLTRAGGPLLFRTVEGLARHLFTTRDHLLAELDGWPQARDRFVALVRHPDEQDDVDLDLLQYNLAYPPEQWLPELLVAARDVVVELMGAFDLDDVGELLGEGSVLDGVDDLMRRADRALSGRSVRRHLQAVDANTVRQDWHRIATRLDEIAAWAD